MKHPSLAITIISCLMFLAETAHAEAIKVLTTGAFKQVVIALAPIFEAQTGHVVHIHNDTAGALVKRIEAGETFDVLILTPSALKVLGDKGTVAPQSITALAKVAIGVAVKSGTPKPSIETVDDFKKALAQANRVAYIDPQSGGSSGIYLDQWFTQQGLSQMIRPKAVLVPGGLVAERLVSGEADLAIHQISEILPVKGVDLVGPLPEAIQNYTVYAGAIHSRTPHATAAQLFVSMLNQKEAAEIVRAKGMRPLP